MADYPNIDPPAPDPRDIALREYAEALRECIAAMRVVMPMIATKPDRDVLKAVADRAEGVPAYTASVEGARVYTAPVSGGYV